MSLEQLDALAASVRAARPDEAATFARLLDALCEASDFVRERGDAAAACLLAAGHALEALAGEDGRLDREATRGLAAGLIEVAARAACPRGAEAPPRTETQAPPRGGRVDASAETADPAPPPAAEGGDEPPRPGRSLLGEILVELGHVEPAAVAEALRMQASTGLALGETLLLTGACAPERVLEALKLQEGLRREVAAASGAKPAARAASPTKRPERRGNAAMHVTTDIFLGEVLLGAEMIGNDELEAAMRMHHLEGVRVGEALLRTGALTEEELEAGIALQESLRGIALKTARPLSK